MSPAGIETLGRMIRRGIIRLGPPRSRARSRRGRRNRRYGLRNGEHILCPLARLAYGGGTGALCEGWSSSRISGASVTTQSGTDDRGGSAPIFNAPAAQSQPEEGLPLPKGVAKGPPPQGPNFAQSFNLRDRRGPNDPNAYDGGAPMCVRRARQSQKSAVSPARAPSCMPRFHASLATPDGPTRTPGHRNSGMPEFQTGISR